MKNEYPLVSIVIPAYNHEKFLSQAIDSVLEQSYSNIEIIVIDDGSTDNTVDVLKSYGKNIYWQTQENIGQAKTLNKGWSTANGEILSYLSADDALEKYAVNESINVLNKNESVVLTYCDFNLIDEDSNIIKVSRRPEYSYFELVVNLNCIPGPGVFFKNSAFERAGYWNPAFKQMPDYEYWLRLGIAGNFKRIPMILANFRVHKASQTFAIPPVEKAEEPVNIMTNYFNCKNIPIEIQNNENRALSNSYMLSMQFHLKAGRYKLGFNRLFRSMRLYPKNFIKFKTYKIILHGLFSRQAHILTWPIRKVFKAIK